MAPVVGLHGVGTKGGLVVTGGGGGQFALVIGLQIGGVSGLTGRQPTNPAALARQSLS